VGFDQKSHRLRGANPGAWAAWAHGDVTEERVSASAVCADSAKETSSTTLGSGRAGPEWEAVE